jgi:hypothetical protein
MFKTSLIQVQSWGATYPPNEAENEGNMSQVLGEEMSVLEEVLNVDHL